MALPKSPTPTVTLAVGGGFPAVLGGELVETLPLAGASGTGSAPDLRLDVSEGLPLRDSATGKWVPIRWRVNGNPAFIRRS